MVLTALVLLVLAQAVPPAVAATGGVVLEMVVENLQGRPVVDVQRKEVVLTPGRREAGADSRSIRGGWYGRRTFTFGPAAIGRRWPRYGPVSTALTVRRVQPRSRADADDDALGHRSGS